MASPKQALWGVAAALAVAFAGFQVWRLVGPQPANGHLPVEFPNAYLAPRDMGDADAVKIWRGRVAPATIEVDGVTCYPAWVCANPACPGLHDGKPFVIAHGYDKDANPGPTTICPRCAAEFAKATGADRGKYDPSQVQVYFTPEAQAMLVKVHAALR
jgi:hypothetical protein